MSDSDDEQAVSRAEADATAARNVFETFRDDLNALLDEVRAGETGRARRLVPMVTELARAVARMADEEGKLDGARHGRGRSGADTDLSELSLDLDSARREVCRRLARLRGAG